MKSKASRRVIAGVVAIILLTMSLTVTSLALALPTASLENNIFQTGIVDINLNDGKQIFYLTCVEPGMTLERCFWLRNDSTTSVYYKVYCTDIFGSLADVLDVKLYTVELDGVGAETSRELIFQGKLSRMIKDNVPKQEETLGIGQIQYFAMQLHFPESSGNALQQSEAGFNLEAMAVQAKNNPKGFAY